MSRLERSAPEVSPSLDWEHAHWQRGQARVVALDEVGRGCLSGPVLAAALIWSEQIPMLSGVRDSKKLSPAKREALYPLIKQQAVAFAFGAASVSEIDKLNILNATWLAMGRALKRVGDYQAVLVDGRPADSALLGEHTAIVDGDRLCYSIACASILAKVARDRLMARLAERYPGYGWERNAGYGTRAHLQALDELGITPFHRLSYAPVRKRMTDDG